MSSGLALTHYLFLHLSVLLSASVFVSMSLCLSFCLSLSFSLSHSLYLSKVARNQKEVTNVQETLTSRAREGHKERVFLLVCLTTNTPKRLQTLRPGTRTDPSRSLDWIFHSWLGWAERSAGSLLPLRDV